MNSEPYVQIEIECHFTQGEPIFILAREGRDTVLINERFLQVDIYANPEAPESTIIDRAKLNGFRTVKRTIHPEPEMPEALREAQA